jgi:poly(A) polymerase
LQIVPIVHLTVNNQDIPAYNPPMPSQESNSNSAGNAADAKHTIHDARSAAIHVLRALRNAGHQAFFAGGCVRDALMGQTPQDYDIATDADPKIVHGLFRGSQYVGEAFGVVLVRVRESKSDRKPQQTNNAESRQSNPKQAPKKKHQSIAHHIEVATFRAEWGYEDGRRPSGLKFTTAENDAQRRDFTINGLFEDPLATDESKRIIDYVGGAKDLNKETLRAIGDPDERFAEDYLRMLRAVRFAARLNFTLETNTTRAIVANAPNLKHISRERIGHELRAMLTGNAPILAIELLQQLQLDGPTLDEACCESKLCTVKYLIQSSEMPVSWPIILLAWMLDRHVWHSFDLSELSDSIQAIQLFCNAGSQEKEKNIDHANGSNSSSITSWRNALCLTNEERSAMRQTLALIAKATNWPDADANSDSKSKPQEDTASKSRSLVAFRKRTLASSYWPSAWSLLGAMRFDPQVRALTEQIESDAAPLFTEGVAPPRLLTGEDLIDLGIAPGPTFGMLLEAVYDAQLDGRVTTHKQAVQWIHEQK